MDSEQIKKLLLNTLRESCAGDDLEEILTALEMVAGALREQSYSMKFTARAMTAEVNMRAYFDWFIRDRGREPKSLLEIAQYLDDERDRGQFADSEAVHGAFHFATEPDAPSMFEEIMKIYRAPESRGPK